VVRESVDLNVDLLDNGVGLIASPGDLNACLNSHGLYNPFQFVLRLSPEVHRRMAALPNGIVTGGIDFDGLQAFSTFLHETIHWWQHIGSTFGLMLSMSYPAQAHVNYTHLKNLIASIGPKKSIRRYVEAMTNPGGPGTTDGLANTVVNNHYDIEFFRILLTRPDLVHEVVEHSFFDCVGHSCVTAYANILLILSRTLDENFSILPDPRMWEKEFADLRSQRQKGHYHGSDVSVSPIGVREIFEGQARFAQLQYLYFASGGRLGWENVGSNGMLKGVYGSAFENFLRLAELDWPPVIDHPVVALFQLVCEIAINPGAGFPLPLQVFTTFIEDVDPGIRFLFLCRTIATKRRDLAGAIRQYSRAEYAEVSEALTRHLIVDSPLAIAETVTRWMRNSDPVKALMGEYRTFDYAHGNLPVRVLFSHFLAFSEDKLAKPEFFCWPGAWMTGDRVSEEVASLFDRHLALFIDKADDGGVYPRLLTGKNEESIQETFDGFYSANVTYDLTRQWITKPGPFEYDYRWLSSSGTHADMKGFADRHFEQIYGVHPDRFQHI